MNGYSQKYKILKILSSPNLVLNRNVKKCHRIYTNS